MWGRERRNTSVHLPVILNFICTSVDEISSCSITIHRLVFPDFMHQNALTYGVTLSLTLAPEVPFLSVGTEACPGSHGGLISGYGGSWRASGGRWQGWGEHQTSMSGPRMGREEQWSCGDSHLAAMDRPAMTLYLILSS